MVLQKNGVIDGFSKNERLELYDFLKNDGIFDCFTKKDDTFDGFVENGRIFDGFVKNDDMAFHMVL